MDVFDKARAAAWGRVPELIDTWTEKCAAPAKDIRRALADVYTSGDVGVYWNPEAEQAGLYFRGKHDKYGQDMLAVANSVERAVGADHMRPSPLLLQDTEQPWVKVAYSPTLRRASELLNFYPGTYPGGFPNSPSPLAATLTSGLVGAGLGYGAGTLAEKLLPDRWQRGKLRKTLALMGGAGMTIPGLLWAYSNHARGKGLWDGSDNMIPRPDQEGFPGFSDTPGVVGEEYKSAVDHFIKQAWGEDDGFDTTGGERNPFAVNINHLGHTLWEVGADPRTTASTMGAIYAAQQLPDPNSRPGFVTPNQTGLLGTMMGAAGGGAKGYAAGWMVGKALGLLTGMPADTQNVLKNSGAVLGIVDAVVPRLFGH